MHDPKNYFIKEGYLHKNGNTTLDVHREENYWSGEKALLSRFYQRNVYLYAASLVRERHLGSVLDVGCGPGYKLMEIIQPICPDVLGIDQGGAVVFGKQRFGDTYFASDDFENPTYSSEKKYDLIICSDVIEHMDNPDLLLSYIQRFCHNNSLVVFSTPERDVLRGEENMQSPNKDHVREWNTKELVAYLTDRGFSVEKTLLFPNLGFHLSRFYLRNTLKQMGRNKHCLTILATRTNSEKNAHSATA